MKGLDASHPIWKLFDAIEAEPTGEFRKLVEAAELDPKVDFRHVHLVNFPLRGADVSGFDFSASDLRGTGLRFVARFDGAIITADTRLDSADRRWWNNRTKQPQQAAAELGGYTREAVQSLIGTYLCVRPVFSNPSNLSAYLIVLSWDEVQTRLVFEEKAREDARYAQKGVVCLPVGIPFMHLLSTSLGGVRTFTLSYPDPDSEGLARGLISTLSNPRGAIYIPVSAPIFLQRLELTSNPELGVITPDNPSHSRYQGILASVNEQEYGVFVEASPPPDRRRELLISNKIA
jgi:hypothetical protein